MTDDVTLKLTRDEALVFFDWLVRFNAREAERFEAEAEQRVLWTLEAALESELVEPFLADYAQLLADARARLRDPVE